MEDDKKLNRKIDAPDSSAASKARSIGTPQTPASPLSSGRPNIPPGASQMKSQAPAAKVIAQYTVKEGDTLSHVALKYYGSAAEAMWRHIYEFNKEVIGDKPGVLRIGITLNIPEKPQDK